MFQRHCQFAQSVVALACVFATVSSSYATSYNFVTLEDPLALFDTQAQAIDGNTIVGDYIGVDRNYHGFMYIDGTFSTIDYPGAPGTSGLGISGSNLTGVFQDSHGTHSFVKIGGTFTPLEVPSALPGSTFVSGIFGSTVVGSFSVGTVGHGFIWNAGTYTTLDYPLSPSTNTWATGISNGTIVGFYNDGLDGHDHSFTYNAGNFISFDDPAAFPAYGTQASGISGNTIVGSYGDSIGRRHGFIDVDGAFTTIDDPLSVNGTVACGVSGDTVVGFFYDANFVQHGFIATPAPEPATLLLLSTVALLFPRRTR